MMPMIFFHFRESNQAEPDNEVLEAFEVPRVGEFVTRHATSPWYRVAAVVHTPFEGEELVAEVYATKVDHMKVLDEWSRDAARD
jgi:hypothetical protein